MRTLLLALVLALPLAAAQEYVAADQVFSFSFESAQPVAGETQRLLIDIFDNTTGIPVGGLAGSLTLRLGLGEASKAFPLEESEEAVGRYVATFIPTQPGNYTATLTGRVNETDVEVVADLPAVLGDRDLQFPTPPIDERLQDIEARLEKGIPGPGVFAALVAIAAVAWLRLPSGERR